ncbi:MAG: MetQ/NlpA family ABC transporter substrate-binding protein, partial [Comamonas sp.]
MGALRWLAARAARWAWTFAALCLLPLGGVSAAQAAPLRIGVLSTVANEAAEEAVALAKAEGLDVQLVEFTDWLLPNTAVVEGSLDANFFQHGPFLEQFNLHHKANLVPVAYGYSTTIGLFSRTLSQGDALPEGASVAIPSDPV